LLTLRDYLQCAIYSNVTCLAAMFSSSLRCKLKGKLPRLTVAKDIVVRNKVYSTFPATSKQFFSQPKILPKSGKSENKDTSALFRNIARYVVAYNLSGIVLVTVCYKLLEKLSRVTWPFWSDVRSNSESKIEGHRKITTRGIIRSLCFSYAYSLIKKRRSLFLVFTIYRDNNLKSYPVAFLWGTLSFTLNVSNSFLTGRRYGDRRFIKWARFCRDSQLA